MCDKAISENSGALKCIPDCYKNHKMYHKAVNKYSHKLEFVPNCYMNQEMCDKVVSNHSSTTGFVPECYKNLKMCDKAFNKCFLDFFIFLININLKKCVTDYFLVIPFY